ncbi:DUF423 domain-containing protein [Flavobacterium jejuense]|uniref:DUF423 domain-containing protein n=1 Tax=Flavobacterium jejuense TaxID=1544455 RepID=A0ABX0ITA7_9FLAO|nr:DUF423 domain-containing protein [Flavobacterium jejuense]NHN27017.1 DUF423 domain-containing protein [Flavobacterium jejuense]
MEKKILLTALLMGIIGIILGAFGAHGLKKIISTEQLATFEVGVRYQIYHAMFLLFVVNTSFLTFKEKIIVFYLALAGVILFSGSIYLLSTSIITSIKTKIIGPLTPLGGLLLIASWSYMFYCVLLKNKI